MRTDSMELEFNYQKKTISYKGPNCDI